MSAFYFCRTYPAARRACIHNGGQIPCAGACGGARRHLIYRAAQRQTHIGERSDVYRERCVCALREKYPCGASRTGICCIYASAPLSASDAASAFVGVSAVSVFLPSISGSCIPAMENTSSRGGTDFIMPERKFAVAFLPSAP